ncbi:MAG: AAA-like domain-containing protein [Synechococcus sp.]
MTAFNLETALRLANQLVHTTANRYLTDIETVVFEGSWERSDYDTIAAKAQYSTGYISQDVAPKLWKILSESLGEKVRKTNFKEALKRYFEEQSEALVAQPQNPEPDSSANSASHNEASSPILKSSQYPSGAISLGSNFYIERTEIETKIEQELTQSGALVRLKAPQEMGKTSIILRVLDTLKQKGFTSVYINFEQADSDILTHLDRLLRWMLVNIAFQLQLKSNLDNYWDAEMGCKLSSTLCLQTILDTVERPVILVINQVNQIFEYPNIAQDFLPLIRSWYEESKRIPVWQKLRIVMVHSTDVYVQLNYHQSPFNVGLPVQVTPFTDRDIQQLAQRYQVALSETDINQLSTVLGGQPALVHVAIYHLSRGSTDLSELLSTAATHSGIYSHHLQRQWETLSDRPELLNAVRLILNATESANLEPHVLHRLNSLGLLDTITGQLGFSCGLYRVYFQSRLANNRD